MPPAGYDTSGPDGPIDWMKLALDYKRELDELRNSARYEVPVAAATPIPRPPAQKGAPPGPPPKRIKDGGPLPPHLSKQDEKGIEAKKYRTRRDKKPKKAQKRVLPGSNGKTFQFHWNAPDQSIGQLIENFDVIKSVPDERGIVQRFLPSHQTESTSRNDRIKMIQETEMENGEESSKKPVYLGLFRGTNTRDTDSLAALRSTVEEAFSRKAKAKESHENQTKKASGKRVSCLGTQLCQKWFITYQALRKNHKTFIQIKKAILTCSLRREEIALLMEVVPDESDTKRLAEWKEAETMLTGLLTVDPRAELYPDEQILKLLLSVPNLRFRIEAMSAQANFSHLLTVVRKDLDALHAAIDILMNNEGIHRLLNIVLEIGNVLNKGTRWGSRQCFRITHLFKVEEMRCNHPSLGKRGDTKRSLLSFIAAHEGSMISENDLLTIRKALEISMVHPYREATALLDVFELMASLEHLQNDPKNPLCRKRRLSTDLERLNPSDDEEEFIELQGTDRPEDPDDLFVTVCVRFVREHRPELDNALSEVGKTIKSYADLVTFLGCPEDLLPIDKKEASASGESMFIKDAIYHLGMFLISYEKEVVLESTFKRKEVEKAKQKKLRELRAALIGPKIKGFKGARSDAPIPLVDEPGTRPSTASLRYPLRAVTSPAALGEDDSEVARNVEGVEETIAKEALDRVADRDDGFDMAGIAAGLLRSKDGDIDTNRSSKPQDVHKVALGIELASQINRRREGGLTSSDGPVAKSSPGSFLPESMTEAGECQNHYGDTLTSLKESIEPREIMKNQKGQEVEGMDYIGEEKARQNQCTLNAAINDTTTTAADDDDDPTRDPYTCDPGPSSLSHDWKKQGMAILASDLDTFEELQEQGRPKRQRADSPCSNRHASSRTPPFPSPKSSTVTSPHSSVSSTSYGPFKPSNNESKMHSDASIAPSAFSPPLVEDGGGLNGPMDPKRSTKRRRLTVSFVDLSDRNHTTATTNDTDNIHENERGEKAIEQREYSRLGDQDRGRVDLSGIVTHPLRPSAVEAKHQGVEEERVEGGRRSLTLSGTGKRRRRLSVSYVDRYCPDNVDEPSPNHQFNRNGDKQSHSSASKNNSRQQGHIVLKQRPNTAPLPSKKLERIGDLPENVPPQNEKRDSMNAETETNSIDLVILPPSSLDASLLPERVTPLEVLPLIPELRQWHRQPQKNNTKNSVDPSAPIQAEATRARRLRGFGRSSPWRNDKEESSEGVEDYPDLNDLLANLFHRSPTSRSDESANSVLLDSLITHHDEPQLSDSAKFIRQENAEERRRASMGSDPEDDLLTRLSTSASRMSLKYVASPISVRRSTSQRSPRNEVPPDFSELMLDNGAGLQVDGLSPETLKLLGIINDD